MTAEFFQLYILRKKDIERKQIEEKLNLALDWYRYSNTNYILYTSSGKDKWHARLKEFVSPEGEMFICKLDVSEKNGWMEPEFWEWINTHKAKKDEE